MNPCRALDEEMQARATLDSAFKFTIGGDLPCP